MNGFLTTAALTAALLVAQGASAQAHGGAHPHGQPAPAPRADSAFSALQERGRVGMGVDQYASTHRFDSLPDGGRIEYLLNDADPEGVAAIRSHLRQITRAFAAGDFRTPAFVHARPVPGTAVMTARRDRIRYAYRELPRGGEVRITTSDPEALRAVHEFLGFQRQDHRVGGRAPDPAHQGHH